MLDLLKFKTFRQIFLLKTAPPPMPTMIPYSFFFFFNLFCLAILLMWPLSFYLPLSALQCWHDILEVLFSFPSVLSHRQSYLLPWFQSSQALKMFVLCHTSLLASNPYNQLLAKWKFCSQLKFIMSQVELIIFPPKRVSIPHCI